MARKAAKKQATESTNSKQVEAKVIELAEQLGAFLGRATQRAEGWLDNETLKKQVTQIRDGAGQLLEQVNRAGAAAKKSVEKAVKARTAAEPVAEPKARKSRGPVDAPGKKHRKPPPQDKISRGMNASATKRAGKKNVSGTMGRGRG